MCVRTDEIVTDENLKSVLTEAFRDILPGQDHSPICSPILSILFTKHVRDRKAMAISIDRVVSGSPQQSQHAECRTDS